MHVLLPPDKEIIYECFFEITAVIKVRVPDNRRRTGGGCAQLLSYISQSLRRHLFLSAGSAGALFQNRMHLALEVPACERGVAEGSKYRKRLELMLLEEYVFDVPLQNFYDVLGIVGLWVYKWRQYLSLRVS